MLRDADQNGAGPLRRRKLALALLFLVSLLNYMDRFALGILLPAMKRGLGMSDAELGFLAGGAVSIFFALAAVPVGWLADRYPRRMVIAASIATWSTMTALCGLASSFAQLAAARILVGVGQAGATAPSNALIADLLPDGRRATGISIYALGLPAGVLMSFLLGGLVVEGAGWRTTLLLFGLPGLLLAAAVAVALPDARNGLRRSDKSAAPAGAVLRRLLSTRSYLHVCLGSGFFTVIWLGLLSWLPSFFVRTYGLSVGEAGARLAVVLGCGQAIGILAGGLAGDRLAARDPRWYLWICTASSLSVIPFVTAAMLAPAPAWALAALLPAFAFGLLQGAPAMAVVQGLAPRESRALAASTYLLIVNVVSGLGSQAIGFGSDWLAASGIDRPLGTALTLVALTCAVWSAAHFRLAARSLASDLGAAPVSHAAGSRP